MQSGPIPELIPFERKNLLGEFLVLSLLLAFAAALRLHGLSDESLWGDEYVTFQHMDAPSLFEYLRRARVSDPTLNPVYFAFCYLWGVLVDRDETKVRLLSVLFGVMTVGCVYALARTLFNRFTAITAGGLLSLSIHHIYFSQEIRMYAVMWFAVALSALAFVRTFGKSRPALWFAVHIAANAALVWTHWFGALFIVTQACFLMISPDARRFPRWTWLGVHAFLAATIAAYISTVDFQRLPRFTKWIGTAGLWDALWTPVQALGLNELGHGEVELPNTWADWIFPFLPVSVLTAFVITHLIRRCGTAPPNETAQPLSAGNSVLFLALWSILPVAFLATASALGAPCWVPRYVGHTTIALYILLAAALDTVRLRRPAIGLALTLCVVGLFVYRLATIERPFRTDFRRIAATLDQRMDPLEQIVVVPAWQDGLLRHYLTVNRSRIRRAGDDTRLRTAVQRACRQTGHAWVVVVGGSPKRIERNLEFATSTMAELQYAVEIERIDGYYHAYILSVTKPT